MKRARKVVFLSHCILNQNTVVEPLARVEGPYGKLLSLIMEKGVGIHQLPCPEFRHLGLARRPMTKEEYDTYEFRSLCRSLADDSLAIVREYIDNGYQVLGLIGINHSPTCSIDGNRGIFMEEYIGGLEDLGLDLAMLDLPTDYLDGDESRKFLEKVEMLLERD